MASLSSSSPSSTLYTQSPAIHDHHPHPHPASSTSLYEKLRIAAVRHREKRLQAVQSQSNVQTTVNHQHHESSDGTSINHSTLNTQNHTSHQHPPVITPYNSIPSMIESSTSASASASPQIHRASNDIEIHNATPISIKQHNQCNKYLTKAVKGGLVKYMLDSMSSSGCPIDDTSMFIKCIPCSVPTHGAMYYDVDESTGELNGNIGIAMCENKIGSQKEFNTVLTHELIHAYDHCRANVNYHRNPYHHACTEIRAANLSGDCTFLNELRRGNFRLTNHHNECVKRRAIISVASNPSAGPEYAEQYVNQVWNQCIKDTKPFGSIPWQ